MTKRQKKLFAGMDCCPGQGDLFPTDGPQLPSPPKPPTPAYTCPNGHRVTWDMDDDDSAPTCHQCDLIATGYNTRDHVVFDWMRIEAFEDACRDLQDQMDEAFDNQYFNEW